jgi:hypothetical protein
MAKGSLLRTFYRLRAQKDLLFRILSSMMLAMY